jgi:hypothetical protein
VSNDIRKVALVKDDSIDSSGFEGTWYMDRAQSRVWDKEANEWRPEPIEAQTLQMRMEGDVMYYKIALKHSEELILQMTYTCRFGDESWVPYRVLALKADENDEHLAPGDILKAGVKPGEPIAYVKQVYVDPRTQYRITRNLDGSAQYIMLRRLSEDGRTNTGTVLDPDGTVIISKVFVRSKPANSISVLQD